MTGADEAAIPVRAAATKLVAIDNGDLSAIACQKVSAGSPDDTPTDNDHAVLLVGIC